MRRCFMIFLAVVVWNGTQAFVLAIQIHGFGQPADRAFDLLDLLRPMLSPPQGPGLGYAVVVFLGLYAVTWFSWYQGRRWIYLAFWVAAWSLVEHMLLLGQTLTRPWFGAGQPTTLLELALPGADFFTVSSIAIAVPASMALWHRLRYERQLRQRMHEELIVRPYSHKPSM